MRSNKVEYSTATGLYCTTHDIKVDIFMLEFSISKITSHHFNVDNNEGELGIGYGMIIGRDLMVQLGISPDFKHKAFQWDGATATTKEPRGLLGQTYLTSREMCKGTIHTEEPVSTREAT